MDNPNIHQNLENTSNNATNDNSIFIPNGQTINVSATIGWIGDAWDFITPKLVMWIVMVIIYGIIQLGLILIPHFGFILPNLLEPLFVAGIIVICEKQRTHGKFELGRFFDGFKYKCGDLLVVGLIVCGIQIISSLLIALIDGDNLYQSVFGDIYSYINFDSIITYNDSESSFLSLMISLISLFLSTACSWFAPALIILKNFNVGKALSISFNAISKNILGVILFFIFMYLLIFLSTLPLFLGLLLTAPLYMATSYSSYRRVFYKKEESSNKL
ncbi:BPSS1780 family membrane protein [Xenorhabdus sp. PB62.4]|uniref:BPSS1780 family membrane protein n=1 Tax=Xenorhabdus sp. PB62.4 TaxID=1851573 RepID=UPI001656A324|nr:BPSS1780 family membrane protein [Xenorhabdus sp. PB62.4]MBC8951770.1 membrane protein [Xenorhabdus sp. PB62.4]